MREKGPRLVYPDQGAGAAFEELKDSWAKLPVLSLPMADRPFMIYPDASAFKLGEVLLQQQVQKDPKKFPTIGYWYRALPPAENNYSTTEREFLYVVWALKALRKYVEGT